AYVQEFASKTRLLATTGIQILQLVEKAPQVLLGDGNFAKMHDAAQKILGVHSEVPRVKPYHPGPSQHRDTCTEKKDVSKDYVKGVVSQLADDVFWNDPDTLVMIDEIMKAVEEQDRFMRMQRDVPSFSLGLSSDDDAGDVAERQHTSDNVFKQPGGMQPEVDVQKLVLGLSDKTTRTFDKTPTIEVSGLVPDQCVTTETGEAGDADRSPRSKRHVNETSAAKSPYIERTIDVNKKLDGHERTIANWTLKNDVND
ncbi:Unknown protein, partial [Striga hermonthica]